MTLRGKPCRYRTNVYGPFGKLLETQIDHESHNDVTRLCWHAGAIFVLLAELGLRKPPSGNPEGLALLGEPVWVGAFGWGGGALTGVTVEGRQAHKEHMHVYLQVQLCGKVQKNYTYTQ